VEASDRVIRIRIPEFRDQNFRNPHLMGASVTQVLSSRFVIRSKYGPTDVGVRRVVRPRVGLEEEYRRVESLRESRRFEELEKSLAQRRKSYAEVVHASSPLMCPLELDR